MDLREGEKILRIYRHHPTPFVFTVLKVILSMIPFYAFLFLIDSNMAAGTYFIVQLILFVVFALVILYVSLIYWLDKLIITNQRIVMMDYPYLMSKVDSFVDIIDIQDIKTTEKGILSYFWVFDYGNFEIETSSSTISIVFPSAPCPEQIRQFLYHVRNP